MMLSRLSCRQNVGKVKLLTSYTRYVSSAVQNGAKIKLFLRKNVLLLSIGGVSLGTITAAKLYRNFKVGVVYSKDVELEPASALPSDNNEKNLIEAVADSDEEKVSEDSSTFLGVPGSFWHEIYDVSKGQVWVLAIAVISAFVSAYFNIKISLQIGDIINVISRFIRSPGGDNNSRVGSPDYAYLSDAVINPVCRLIVSYFAQAVATFAYISSMSYFGEHLGVELRIRLLQRLLFMEAEFYDRRHRIGDLLNNITHDTQQFKSAFKQVVGQGLKNTVQMVGCATSLVMISPILAAGLGLPLCGMIFFGSVIGRILRRMSNEAQGNLAKATSLASESLYGVSTIRAFAVEKEQGDRYASQLRSRFLSSSVSLGCGIGMLQSLSNLAINGMVVGVVFLGGWQISTGQVTPGELMSFLMASQSLQKCMAQTSVLISDMVKGCSAACRMAEILSLKPEIPYAGGRKVPFHSLVGDIEFKDVFLTYQSRSQPQEDEEPSKVEIERQSALSGLNLTIPGGSITAITGPSGAGKSTLAYLLERFYDPTTGSIFLDKIDLRLYDLSWLRRRAIGFVGQEPVLFAGTVAENIRFGKPDATDQEIQEAAEAASADQFIQSELPNGYDTMIGERGVLLSGGQKQRIALARALIKNPPILVLDEISSALDAESERAIHKALEKGSPHGRTVVMITHRLNWARRANHIIVLEAGKVAEQGTHEALMAKRGLYYRLWNEQQSRETPKK